MKSLPLLPCLPLVISLLALLSLALSGFGVRQGWWPLRLGFLMLEWSAYAGLAAAVCAFAFMASPLRRGALPALLVGLVVGLVTAFLPWQWKQQAQALPKIHDISTDLTHPPVFEKILPLRAIAPNPAAYGGEAIAAEQRKGYPDIQPREVAFPPAETFARALAAASGMGWQIVDADAGKGIIEATDTTLWFGFKDDIVIRIVPAGTGSRIDMRSVSRVGKSDVGTNAARIRKYFATLAKP